MVDKIDEFRQILLKFEIAVLNQKPDQIDLFNQLIQMFQANISNGWISMDKLDEKAAGVKIFCWMILVISPLVKSSRSHRLTETINTP